jgi:4-carboxymuconolactone decarboxylase
MDTIFAGGLQRVLDRRWPQRIDCDYTGRGNKGVMKMPSEQYEVGLKIRKEVLGAEYVDKALAAADDFNREFQDLVTEYCWGGIWGRGVLSKQQRSLNNLCMLAALNRPNEFEMHFRGALRNGCSLEEIKETLLQIAIYCGIPAGVEAFRIGRKVLAEGPPETEGASS